VETDSVDRIVRAWRNRDAGLDSSSLEVIGRLLLCAGYHERLAMAALQPFGLTIADFDVINTLRRVADPSSGCKPTDLARASLITTGAMTARLDRLERAALIRRSPDPADRRGVLVHLTPKGSKVARRALHELIALNEVFLEPLGEDERESIAAALKLLLLRQERSFTEWSDVLGEGNAGRLVGH
jgi:DNA-binding MarR family transcriptional regulator